MVRVDTGRWHQTPDDLRRLAVESGHPRTRERFLALYEVTQGESALNSATRTDRRHSTILEWIHSYNERGPEALVYRRTGGWPRLLSSISSYINELINKATEAAAYPREPAPDAQAVGPDSQRSTTGTTPKGHHSTGASAASPLSLRTISKPSRLEDN